MNRREGMICGVNLLIGLLLMLSGLGCTRLEGAEQEDTPQLSARDQPPCVRVAAVESATIRDELRLRANLIADRQAPVLPRNGGWISELRVDAGDRVVGGETIMAIIQMEALNMNVGVAQAATQMARAGLSQAEVQLQQAQNELGRVEALFERGAATQQQVEQVRTMVATLEEVVNQARAQVRMLRTQARQAEDLASDSEVIAPFDGVVAARLVEVGQYLTSFPPMPLFLVIDPGQIRVIANVAERYADQVEVGSEVVIEFAGGQELTTTISYASPDLDMVSRTRRVWALVENSEGRLRHGGSARVRIRLAEFERPVLPRHAISEIEGNRGYVFVLNPDGESVRQLSVPLGSLEDQYYSVLGELEVGDLIVTDGWFRLSEGTRVRVAQGEVCASGEES